LGPPFRYFHFQEVRLKESIWLGSQWEKDKGRKWCRGRERRALAEWLRGVETRERWMSRENDFEIWNNPEHSIKLGEIPNELEIIQKITPWLQILI
jgi:hypothetical protein